MPADAVDFNLAPYIAIWEVTRACDLACLHCRAEAQHRRHPDELRTDEGLELIDQLADMGAPLLILTGGDPAKRPDLAEFIARGVSRGIKVSVSPSATPLVTREVLRTWAAAGATRIHLSLDGSGPETHDAFRGVPGTFDLTMRVADDAHAVGLTIQTATTVSRINLHDVPGIAQRVAELDAVLWTLFLLVPTGRGREEDMITAEECETLFEWLADLRKEAAFDVRTTEGYHFRRVLMMRGVKGMGPGTARPLDDGIKRPRGFVNAGKGFCFISHTGKVYPSGFLPVEAGDLRRQPLAEIYRESPAFRNLRDPDLIEGKCGACEFRKVCGGSRSRAYALTGNYLASDPTCIYEPAVLRKRSAS